MGRKPRRFPKGRPFLNLNLPGRGKKGISRDLGLVQVGEETGQGVGPDITSIWEAPLGQIWLGQGFKGPLGWDFWNWAHLFPQEFIPWRNKRFPKKIPNPGYWFPLKARSLGPRLRTNYLQLWARDGRALVPKKGGLNFGRNGDYNHHFLIRLTKGPPIPIIGGNY